MTTSVTSAILVERMCQSLRMELRANTPNLADRVRRVVNRYEELVENVKSGNTPPIISPGSTPTPTPGQPAISSRGLEDEATLSPGLKKRKVKKKNRK